MGFCMTCTNTCKNCGYSTWYEQRTEIIKIVVKYLESKIPEIQNELEEKRDREDEEECLYINGFPTIDYDYYLKTIKNKFLDPIKKAKKDDEIFKIVENPQMYHIKDILCCFGVYGIHLLCRQGDCGGVYTVGESLEILQLLKTIKPYFDPSSYIYETVYTIKSEFSSPIYNIFNDSVTNLTPIRIS